MNTKFAKKKGLKFLEEIIDKSKIRSNAIISKWSKEIDFNIIMVNTGYGYGYGYGYG